MTIPIIFIMISSDKFVLFILLLLIHHTYFSTYFSLLLTQQMIYLLCQRPERIFFFSTIRWSIRLYWESNWLL